MKKYFLIISISLFIFHYSNTFAQDSHTIDSLKQVLKNATHDTTRVITYFTWGELIDYESPDSAIILYNKAKDLAEKSLKGYKNTDAFNNTEKLIFYTLKKYLAWSLNDIAAYYDSKGEIPKALEYNFRSLKIQEELNDKVYIANSLNNIGYIYNNQGNISKALEYYNRSLLIQIEIDDKEGIAASLNNIGYIYYNQGDTTKALEYYYKSLEILENIKFQEGIAYSLNNIGKVFYAQGKKSMALEYFFKSLKIREKIKDKQGIAYSLNTIGEIYDNQGDISKALAYFQKSLKIQEEIANKRGISYCLVNIGNLKFKMDEIIESKDIAQDAYKLAVELEFPENIEGAASLLKKIYEKQGNFKQAYYYYGIEMKMRDTIANKDNFKKTQKLQAKFEYIKAIDLKNLELSRSEKIKEKQRIVIYAFLLGLIIVVLFSFLLFRQYYAKKKANVLLAQKNIDIQQKNNEITIQRDEIQKQNIIIEHKNANITASINYAKRIQSAILPPKELIEQIIPESFIFFKPKSIVSGDFYWLEQYEQYIYIAAVDCTGHGVPGALMSMVGYNILNQALNEKQLRKPSEIINHLSLSIAKTLRQKDDSKSISDGMDIMLCRIDKSTNMLEFSGSHLPLYIVRQEQLEEIKSDIFSIGHAFSNEFQGFRNQNFQLIKNDMLYLFSDGYIDQFNGKTEQKYSSHRFKNLLIKLSILSINEQLTNLEKEFLFWKGSSEQIDDVMVIGIRI